MYSAKLAKLKHATGGEKDRFDGRIQDEVKMFKGLNEEKKVYSSYDTCKNSSSDYLTQPCTSYNLDIFYIAVLYEGFMVG